VADIDDIKLADLGEAELQRLIAAGEDGGVERKAKPPREGLAPSVAAFANSGGGWLLLGVDDDATIRGFAVPGRAQPHDWLRERLQRAIDPLPNFETATVSTVDGDVLVVRIPPSAATPHVLRDRGVVYAREPGGKRPVDTQARLVAMCLAPRQAEELAVARLREPPLVRGSLAQRMNGPVANGQTRVADWLVAATPLHVPDAFAERTLTKTSVREVEQTAGAALRHLAEATTGLHLSVASRARGYVATGGSTITKDEFELTVDAGGSAVARWSTRLFRGTHHLPALADNVLLPLLRLTAAPIAAAGADGAVLVHGLLSVTPTDHVFPAVLTISAGSAIGELLASPEAPMFLGGRLTSTNDDELRTQADSWMRELGRAAGLETWEP
jgi:hypothetical protein